jgi:hypothetical protein
MQYNHNVSYRGYYQHENYISNIISDFYQIVSLKQPTVIRNNTIFIHVRLGDYIKSAFHNVRLQLL